MPDTCKRKELRSHLVGDIRAGITNVSVHLPHDTNVLVAVEQRILVVALHAHAATATVRCLISLETGIGEDDNESLRVLVALCDGQLLLSYELRQGGRRKRLRACGRIHRVSFFFFFGGTRTILVCCA